MAGTRLRNVKLEIFQVAADEADDENPDAHTRLMAEYETWRQGRKEESFIDMHFSTTDGYLALIVIYTD